MAGFGLGNYINPGVGSWIDQRRNALAGLGAGLLNGQPGAGVQAGIQADDAYATQQKAEAERQKQIADQQALRSKYADFFTKQGRADIAQGIADGMVDPATAYWEFVAPKQADPVKGIEINGQLVNPITGEPMGDFRTPESGKPKDAPSGYQWTPEGTLSFVPGGPADPSTNAKTTEATRRNQQLAKVLVPEAQSLLGPNGTFDALTNGGDQFWSGVNQGTGIGTSPQFQQAQNSIKTVVASYLYSVSGATATDDEVKRQTDVLTPKPFESKQSVAQKKARLQQMVEAVVEAANGTPMGAAPSGGGYTVLSVE